MTVKMVKMKRIAPTVVKETNSNATTQLAFLTAGSVMATLIAMTILMRKIVVRIYD